VGGVRDLLADAERLVPAWRLRADGGRCRVPAGQSGQPAGGALAGAGLLAATGHGRNGILLLPGTVASGRADRGGTMRAVVNGEEWELADGATVADVLLRLGAPATESPWRAGRGRAEGVLAATPVRDGDDIEVLTAVQGG